MVNGHGPSHSWSDGVQGGKEVLNEGLLPAWPESTSATCRTHVALAVCPRQA